MDTLAQADPTPAAAPDVRLIPIDQLTPSQHQARKEFDEEGIRGLAESIRQEGQMQPILVRESGSGFELISGERRLRAMKLLGQETIEAKVIKTVSEAEAAVKGMVENIQRKDLNPIEEAAGFQEINQLDGKYWTQGRIADVSGRTQPYISQSFKILELPEAIQENIRRLGLTK